MSSIVYNYQYNQYVMEHISKFVLVKICNKLTNVNYIII